MAVLVEAISVVIKLEAIKDRYPGGFAAFKEIVPNQTLCWDDHIVRVGFMAPQDANEFVEALEASSLCHLDNDECAVNLVKIDQVGGPLCDCDWITTGQLPIDAAKEQYVGIALLHGTDDPELSLPIGWKYERSLSQQFAISRPDEIGTSLKFLRHEDGNDVFHNVLTGGEVYMGRT